MSARRRGLMASGTAARWELTETDLRNLILNGATALYDADGNLFLQNASPNTYRGGYKTWNFDPAYEYMVDYDVAVFKGVHVLGFSTSPTGNLPATSGAITTTRHINFTFSITQTINYMRVFCSFSVSEVGACMLSNFKMYRRLL